MPGSVQQAWQQLQDSVATPQHSSVLGLVVYLTLGGVLALYLRFLYARYSRVPMEADAVARVFPLLTLVTTAVIAVVKTSLALSLGLVGALSIVRFRAAIKDPEELVYLFLCIAVGLALGAEQPLIAIALVSVATVFIVIFDRARGGRDGRIGDAAISIVGNATRYFDEPGSGALAAVREVCPRVTVQRCDVDGDQGQLRVQVHSVRMGDGPEIVAALRKRLPECEVSFVNTAVMF